MQEDFVRWGFFSCIIVGCIDFIDRPVDICVISFYYYTQLAGMNSKNLQSRIRELIQTWARCALSFKTDADAILVLLENLRRQQDTMKSIDRTLNPTAMPLCPLLRVKSDKLDSSLHSHSDLKTKLRSKLLAEIESTSILIKNYQRGLGDVFLALQFAANDACRLLEQNSIKEVSGIAPVLLETVLDVKRLQWMYDHDYHRRRSLLRSLNLLPASIPENGEAQAQGPQGPGHGQWQGQKQERGEGISFVQPLLLERVIRLWVSERGEGQWDEYSKGEEEREGDGGMGVGEENGVFSAEDMMLLNNIIASNADRSQTQTHSQSQTQSQSTAGT